MIQQGHKHPHQTKKHYSLETSQLFLRPYSRSYVPEYHKWFSQYPQLLYLTGSQPLTLEEELENHKSWLEDPKKYTFIIFAKQNNQMIGDVNLFFSDWVENNEAEINIMIAVPQFRGKGLSKQVMEAIQLFALGVYQKDTIIAKIKDDNLGSIKFFAKIGYTFIQDNPHYQEKQFRKSIGRSKEEAAQELEGRLKIKQILDIESLYL